VSLTKREEPAEVFHELPTRYCLQLCIIQLFGKLHHSALSALRNLSIPSMYSLWIFSDQLPFKHIIYVGQNKPLFLQIGVVDVGLSLLMQSTQAHIQVKAFSLLRLLAEKQGTYIHN
jgi:hypothetical protein